MALIVVKPSILLDTNIVIGLLKGDSECIRLLEVSNCELAEMAVSQITRMELLGFAGLSADDEQIIQQFLASVHVVLLDEPIEARTIALRRRHKIKLPDAIIAASALALGMQLVTLDAGLHKIVKAESASGINS